MTSLRGERLRLDTMTRADAAAIAADDRTDRGWAPDFPIEGDRLVAALILEAGGLLSVRLTAVVTDHAA